MKGSTRLGTIVLLLIALWIAYQFATFKPTHLHDHPFVFPSITLPHLNLSGAGALAASANSDSSGYSVTGKPTISATFINRVLETAGSPAIGTGQALYDLGVQYGIDPVFALAFFQHESGYGTAGMARVTRSLGNLRCTADYACYKGYAAFGSWQAGYVAWYRLIANLYCKQWQKCTVETIVPTYAPSGDGNNVADYIQAIEQSVEQWRAGQG